MISSPSYQANLQFEHRGRKRIEVEDFFSQHLGQRFSSHWLHWKFGSGIRARISEINNDPAAAITIRNECFFDQEADAEVSGYVAELRGQHRDE